MKDCTTCKYFCRNYHEEWIGVSTLHPGNYCVRNGLSSRDAVLIGKPVINCSNYERKENQLIDNSEETAIWNQRRYELSKEFMSVIMGRLNYDPMTAHYNYCTCSYSEEEQKTNPYTYIAQISVEAANALIDILKEKEVRDEK